MAHIVFYTKPGCGGGAKQMSLLKSSGHTIEERSILDEKWTQNTLKPYLEKLALKDWFNKNAPDVKAGIVIPGELNSSDTLELMCKNPILIKRPLMIINEQLIAGFDVEFLSKIVALKNIPEEDLTECQNHSKVNPCNVTN